KRMVFRGLCLLLAGSMTAVADEAESVVPGTRAGSTKRPPAASAKAAGVRAPVWLDALARGYADAQKSDRPIFVKAGGEDCRFCRALDLEIARPEVQAELKRWTLVAIDVDKSPDDTRL